MESEHQQRYRVDYDAELRRYNGVLRRACAVQPADHVLDIGCGTGQTTRQAARAAVAGDALGVDILAPAIARAGELARAEGVPNAGFLCADAQLHRFPPDRFDLAISRFGTMFFRDPVAAFSNIGRSLRPGGRLVMLVWQAREHNEWALAIHESIAGPEAAPPPDGPSVPDAFSLADPGATREMLEEAAFTDISCADVREPVYYGPDVPAALDWVRGFSTTDRALKQLDPGAATQVLRRLRGVLAEHARDDGVWFDSRAWLISARKSIVEGGRVT
jgi:SAM-dependent methyltransferase